MAARKRSSSEALLLQDWFERGSASDTEQARLLTEAFAALRERSAEEVHVHLVMILSFRENRRLA
jgi:hypothetical protein